MKETQRSFLTVRKGTLTQSFMFENEDHLQLEPDSVVGETLIAQ